MKLCAAVFFVILSVFQARAVECLNSANEIWKAYPGSWATWSLRVVGHEGSKCWHVGNRREVKRTKKIKLPPLPTLDVPRERPRSVPPNSTISRDGTDYALSAAATLNASNKIIALLEEMGWIDYLEKYQRLVEDGEKIAERRYPQGRKSSQVPVGEVQEVPRVP